MLGRAGVGLAFDTAVRHGLPGIALSANLPLKFAKQIGRIEFSFRSHLSDSGFKRPAHLTAEVIDDFLDVDLSHNTIPLLVKQFARVKLSP